MRAEIELPGIPPLEEEPGNRVVVESLRRPAQRGEGGGESAGVDEQFGGGRFVLFDRVLKGAARIGEEGPQFGG